MDDPVIQLCQLPVAADWLKEPAQASSTKTSNPALLPVSSYPRIEIISTAAEDTDLIRKLGTIAYMIRIGFSVRILARFNSTPLTAPSIIGGFDLSCRSIAYVR